MDRLRRPAKTFKALRALRTLLDTVWPPEALPEGAQPDFLTGPLCRTCARPVEIDLGDETVCAVCTAKPPVWDHAAAALIYGPSSRQPILSLKHAGRRQHLAVMGRWMAQAGSEMLDRADVLVPVPLHWTRLSSRGFNQSVWLAAAVARARPIPLDRSSLKRVRRTPTQGGLSGAARRRNVSGAFRVTKAGQRRLAGKRVVLVDDVLTTGATLRACARTLKRAGAARVDILVLARVVRDETPPI